MPALRPLMGRRRQGARSRRVGTDATGDGETERVHAGRAGERVVSRIEGCRCIVERLLPRRSARSPTMTRSRSMVSLCRACAGADGKREHGNKARDEPRERVIVDAISEVWATERDTIRNIQLPRIR